MLSIECCTEGRRTPDKEGNKMLKIFGPMFFTIWLSGFGAETQCSELVVLGVFDHIMFIFKTYYLVKL